MKIHGYQCDECGVQKKESNHWILAIETGAGIQFGPWDDLIARAPHGLHLCGPGCATKVLSKSIHEWSQR